jgi:drug/metabolite transporter (DMT)-like permease
MPLSALALVLAAAVLHALWNIAAKKAGGDSRFVLIVTVMQVTLWAPVGIWAGWDVIPNWGAFEWSLVVGSGLTHLIYFNVLLRGYAVSDLTVVYPVARGSGPLLSALGAVLLLGESLSALGVAGVLAVTCGIILIAGGPGLWRKAHDPAQRQRVHAGIAWGAATGALISAYTLVDGYAVKVALISPLLIEYFGSVTRMPFMLPQVLRHPDRFMQAWRAQWRYGLIVAAFSPLAYVLVLFALKLAPLSHVAPAREVSMLFAALIGGRMLGEEDRGPRLLGAAFMALGVIGLALG